MPHTFLEIVQVLGLEKLIEDADLKQKISTAVSWLEDNRRWLEDQNGTSVSRINTLGRTYTTEQVNQYLFGDGANGSTFYTLSSRLRYSPRWTSLTIPSTVSPSGYRMQANGTLTIPAGVIISAGGNNGSIGGQGAYDGNTGKWQGGNGTRHVWDGATLTSTEAEDIPYWGGGEGGFAAPGAGTENRGGGVNGGALLGNTLDSFESLLSVPVGGGAGGGAAWAYNDTYAGGGGAGVICIMANTLDVTSASSTCFRAIGGNGYAGAGGTRSTGGGGGGVIFIIARTFLPNKEAVIAKCNVSGGTGTIDGANGQPGRAIVLTVDELGLP
jgi:hypothetical protein